MTTIENCLEDQNMFGIMNNKGIFLCVINYMFMVYLNIFKINNAQKLSL